MTPINNSDTAWLIVTDYNQENDKFYEELREDILNPEIHSWYYEYSGRLQVVVGTFNVIEGFVGHIRDEILNIHVGGGYGGVGGGFVISGNIVGGHAPN